MQRSMSREEEDDGITVVAPVPPTISRWRPEEEEDGMRAHPLLSPAPERLHGVVNFGFLRRLGNRIANFVDNHLFDYSESSRQFSDEDYCIYSCFIHFVYHAFLSVLLHVFCCICLRPLVAVRIPDEASNRRQKLLGFCIKQLSNLWASSLVVFIAWWFVLRPFDVKPRLGACIVNELELHDQWQLPAGSPHLHQLSFNLTTNILFMNSNRDYSIGYYHPAAVIFYAGEKIGPADDELPPFKQSPQERTIVHQVITGRRRNASSTMVETFLRDKVQGRFHMVMRIRVTLSYKFWPFKGDYFTLYDCPFSFPSPNIGGEPAMSSPVFCNTASI